MQSHSHVKRLENYQKISLNSIWPRGFLYKLLYLIWFPCQFQVSYRNFVQLSSDSCYWEVWFYKRGLLQKFTNKWHPSVLKWQACCGAIQTTTSLASDYSIKDFRSLRFLTLTSYECQRNNHQTLAKISILIYRWLEPRRSLHHKFQPVIELITAILASELKTSTPLGHTLRKNQRTNFLANFLSQKFFETGSKSFLSLVDFSERSLLRCGFRKVGCVEVILVQWPWFSRHDHKLFGVTDEMFFARFPGGKRNPTC